MAGLREVFFYQSYTSAMAVTNVLSWCLRCILWIETILSLKKNNVMSGEQTKVKKRPLIVMPGSTYIYTKNH